jgi:hypothetical protein
VVWDREGEEGMRVIQRKGKGKEGEGKGRGREGRGGRKEEEDDLAPPKFLDPPLDTINHVTEIRSKFQRGYILVYKEAYISLR